MSGRSRESEGETETGVSLKSGFRLFKTRLTLENRPPEGMKKVWLARPEANTAERDRYLLFFFVHEDPLLGNGAVADVLQEQHEECRRLQRK